MVAKGPSPPLLTVITSHGSSSLNTTGIRAMSGLVVVLVEVWVGDMTYLVRG